MTSPASAAQSRPSASTRISIHGRFLWHELLVPDVAAATSFYQRAVGWTVQTMPNPSGTGAYTILARGERGQAGVYTQPAEQLVAGAKSLWYPYVGTDDIDATWKEAMSLGATEMMPPTTLPTVGRIAVLRDPQGATFALITPEPAGEPERAPTEQEFAWHEMAADDFDASFGFYHRLFGWKKLHAMDMGKDGVYQMYGHDEFTYGGFMRRAAGMPPTSWNCYIRVADLDATVDAVKRNGGTIVMGPHQVPNDDRVAVAVDNQGAVISFVGKIIKSGTR